MSPALAGDVQVGKVLRDTYEIVSLLGKGGMGAVFLARHLRLPDKEVAIKVLRTDEKLASDVYVRFRREAKIAAKLNHQHIAQVMDYDQLEDGTPFLVMEYLRGESLSRRLRKGPLPFDVALSFARQVGSALQVAHREGVVHRDLKPGNVFLVPTEVGGVVGEQVKLLDFGVSKIMDSLTLQTQNQVLLGTPLYMAPEQAQGRNSDVDARTDIFSLGTLIYEMLTNELPFSDQGKVHDIIHRIVNQPPVPLAQRLPDVPRHVAAAIEKALAKRPENRYPDVASFIEDLTGSPLEALPASEPRQRRPASAMELHVDPPPDDGPKPAPAPVGAQTVAMPRGARRPKPPSLLRSKVLWASVAAGAAVGLVALLVITRLFPGTSVTPPPTPTPVAQPQPKPDPTDKPVGPVGPNPTVNQVDAPDASVVAQVQPPDAGVVAQVQPLDAGVATPPDVHVGVTDPVDSKPKVQEEKLSAQALKHLELGERALEKGRIAEALAAARRSRSVQRSGASQSLIVRAYCQKKSKGGARAEWARVDEAQRPVVREYCQRYGIKL